MRTKYLSALIAAVAAAIMLIGAGSAAASECPRSIRGEGSSLQRLAQAVWGERFQSTCTGGGSVSYNPSGSGAGLSAWHAEGRAGSITESGDHFIGTDDAPESGQVTNIRNHAGSVGVAVLPVAQAAVAVIVHRPSGCTISQIENRSLEEVWAGVVTNWQNVSPAPAESVRGVSCNRAITLIVRKDSSGTTFQFKHYLFLINGAVRNGRTWLGWQEQNTSWPATVTVATNTGGAGLVELVERTEGAIGYANLGDALGGTVTILEVQNNGIGGTPTYRNPRESGIGANAANCGSTQYRENLGTGKILTERTETNEVAITLTTEWRNVYGSNPTSTTYSICTLTWDVAVLNYRTAGYEERIGRTVKEYLGFLLESTGQTRAEERHYGKLPTTTRGAVAAIAERNV